jgi:hypothetical protein
MTLRVKDGENTRYFIVSSVEARHKKYSFHGLNQICHYHQVSECLWVESDVKAHSHIVALQDIIIDALVSRMEDTGETFCAPLRRRMSNVHPDIEHINSMTYDKGSGLKSWRAARESQGHLRFHT